MNNILIRDVKELSKVVRNTLFRRGVKTIGDLQQYVADHPFVKPYVGTDYEAWRGIGPKHYEEILQVLNNYKERA